jgi:hypothetical protein
MNFRLLVLGIVVVVAAGYATAAPVRITAEVVDSAGTPAVVFEVGEELELRVFGQDMRSADTGFRGGSVNMTWNGSVLRCQDDLGSDPFSGSVGRLNVIDVAVWDGPLAGAKVSGPAVERLTFAQAPPGRNPLGSGSPILLFRLRFSAAAEGEAELEIAPDVFSFVGGGLASAADCEVEIADVTVVGASPAPAATSLCPMTASLTCVTCILLLACLQRKQNFASKMRHHAEQ